LLQVTQRFFHRKDVAEGENLCIFNSNSTKMEALKELEASKLATATQRKHLSMADCYCSGVEANILCKFDAIQQCAIKSSIHKIPCQLHRQTAKSSLTLLGINGVVCPHLQKRRENISR